MTQNPSSHIHSCLRFLFAGASLVAFAVPVSLAQAGKPMTPPSSLPDSSPYVATMTFDVASVRESKPDVQKGFMVGGGFTGNSGSLKMTNNSIMNMLGWAYGVSWHQIQGLPDWTSGPISPMYNVQAKADDAAAEQLAKLTPAQVTLEQQHMMQALMADRFKLKAHWETREASVYNLVVAKGGPKMHPGGSMPPSAEELKAWGDGKMPEIHQRGNGGRGYEFIGQNCHMGSLAGTLGFLMGTDVIDKTGLSGSYDFDLQYSQASEEEREADSSIWPRVTDAVEDQLGLKLERAKGPVKMLVVDHIERPSEN